MERQLRESRALAFESAATPSFLFERKESDLDNTFPRGTDAPSDTMLMIMVVACSRERRRDGSGVPHGAQSRLDSGVAFHR